jgi:hypothetical protein
MKRVKELDFFKNIREIREFEFGVFYYFDGLVISEIKEGIVLEWEMAEMAVLAAQEIFKENQPIVYISNRINNYSIIATDWVKFFKNRQQLAHYAVVGRTKGNFASVVLEKMFFKNSIVQFQNLDDALLWALEKII